MNQYNLVTLGEGGGCRRGPGTWRFAHGIFTPRSPQWAQPGPLTGGIEVFFIVEQKCGYLQ